MLDKKKIVFLGAGSMAEAMISGLVNANKIPLQQLIVTNRNNQERLGELTRKYGVKAVKREELDYENIDVLVLAMKPKDIDKAIHSIQDYVNPKQIILSVLAGIPTSYIQQNLQNCQQVIRVMPNTSSMIGESATAIAPGEQTTQESIQIAKDLLKAIGEVYVMEEEKMDIFTGIGGSGPAYFYYLMEYMEQEGLENGLDVEVTRQIIAQTILGAAKMIKRKVGTPAELRQKVTSPNGTTAAGLNALNACGGGNAIKKAVRNASRRSKEISIQLQQQLHSVDKKI